MSERRTVHWLLVVIVALALISPWPILGLMNTTGGKWYILAIPVSDYSVVAPTILDAPQFAIVNVKTSTTTVVPNPYVNVKDRAGAKCGRLLADRDVSVVIAKGVSREAYQSLTKRGIGIYIGNPTTLDDAVYQLRNGMMVKASGPMRLPAGAGPAPDVVAGAPRSPNAVRGAPPAPAFSSPSPSPSPSPPPPTVTAAGSSASTPRVNAGSAAVYGPFQLPRLGMEVFGSGAAVTVYRVYVGSRAERGGLRGGDGIVRFGDTAVVDVAHLIAAVSQAREESVMSIDIVRQGQMLRMNVTMGEGEMERVLMPTNPAPIYSPAQPMVPHVVP